jgi:hypothetical protein
MSTEVVCPDCGKTIAPRGSIDESARCRCAESATARARTQNLDDEIDSLSTRQQQDKTCYICGASLAGRVRLKDHLGRYWCKQCASADKRAKRHEEKGRCADCSRIFAPDKLIMFQNVKVCSSCFKVREKALEKKITKENFVKAHEGIEKTKLIWMAVIAGGLVLIATLFQLLRHGH